VMQQLTSSRIMAHGELMIAETLHKVRLSIVNGLRDELEPILSPACVIEDMEKP
jgi:UDP-N-acetylglucosamine enolpyruvyl transferase